jgi:septal ring factor EnvC (AmiA/AmiB activator)
LARARAGSAPVQRSAPRRRSAPGAPTQRPGMLNGKVGKVEKLEATVAQQQKQIQTLTAQLREQAETFTAQLKEQATQIQKVSAQLEASKPASQVVNNP